MTAESLSLEIKTATDHFKNLNFGRQFTFKQLSEASEGQLIELADRIARLHRFRGLIWAKENALDKLNTI
jgi:hypothetical protein